MKRLTIEIDEDLFYKLKSFCLKNKITLKDFLTKEIIKKIEDKKH